MVVVKEKTLVKPKMKADCLSHARTDCSTRDVTQTIDEPIARGGTNLGLTPTETMLAALPACTNVIGNRIAENMGLHIESMVVDMDYDFDPRGAQLKEEVALPFPEIRMNITVKTTATKEQMEQVGAELDKYCPVGKMFLTAGTKIKTSWSVVAP